jgi:hypothetical protein
LKRNAIALYYGSGAFRWAPLVKTRAVTAYSRIAECYFLSFAAGKQPQVASLGVARGYWFGHLAIYLPFMAVLAAMRLHIRRQFSTMELMVAVFAGVGLVVAIRARAGELQTDVAKFHFKVAHVVMGTWQVIHSEAAFVAH